MATKKSIKNSHNIFPHFVCAVLCFCLLIILWGAWVRISHSGDGCGQSWPSCQGQYFIDTEKPGKTWIEWIHRATSGLFGMTVILLVILSFLKFPPHHPVRKSTLYVLFFTISEALIGAGLVLAGLTGSNVSPARVLIMNLHLLNSLLLTSCLFICWRLSLKKSFVFPHLAPFVFIPIFFLIAFFGSLSSLASSLFPSSSLWEGLTLDFASESPWLIRLRLLHPLLALIFGGGFLLYFFTAPFSSPRWKAFALCLSLALLSGLMNLLLLSPVILKLTHLLLVYFLTMSFILILEKPNSNEVYSPSREAIQN